MRVDPAAHEIFLMASPLPLPLNFAYHTWIVINLRGHIERWEVWQQSGLTASDSWGHVYKNLFKPFAGVRRFYNQNAERWQPRVLGHYKKPELAIKMHQFIANKAPDYAYRHTYRYFPGPNSNTFTKWLAHQFPETGFNLPLRAFGQAYSLPPNP